jgi:hypothetical protein
VFTLFLWFLFLYVRRAVVPRHLLFYFGSPLFMMVKSCMESDTVLTILFCLHNETIENV